MDILADKSNQVNIPASQGSIEGVLSDVRAEGLMITWSGMWYRASIRSCGNPNSIHHYHPASDLYGEGREIIEAIDDLQRKLLQRMIDRVGRKSEARS